MLNLFPSKITAECFGGATALFTSLMKLGLIRDECDGCHCKNLELTFETPDSFPRATCLDYGYRTLTLRRGTIFDDHNINNVPGFIFVVNCYMLRVPFEATVHLSGLAEGTVRRYQGYIRDMINVIIERQNRAMERQLGGEGKSLRSMKSFSRKENTGAAVFPPVPRRSYLA